MAGRFHIPFRIPHRTPLRNFRPYIRPCTAGTREPPHREWYSSEEPLTRYKKGGYCPLAIGDELKHGRYTIMRKLGWGRYSTIWLAKDNEKGVFVSLKILTAEWTPRTDVISEVEFLRRASTADPSHPGFSHVLTLLDEFGHESSSGPHICFATEVLGEDLVKVRRRYDGGRLPVEVVKQVSRQVILGLEYLHAKCNITHTDMKPDNVLIAIEDPEAPNPTDYATKFIEAAIQAIKPESETVECKETGAYVTLCVSQPIPVFSMRKELSGDKPLEINVKIVDLGVANWSDNHWADTIQAPALRAPEVILGAGWDTSADIWSTGCIIFELVLGDWLFVPRAGENYSAEHDHLAQMAEIIEPFPPDLIEKGEHSSKYFNGAGQLADTDHPARGTLEHLVESYEVLKPEEFVSFISFLRAMLRLRPQDRATATELLSHQWLRDGGQKHWWSM